jgi:hypothetical protein
MLLRFRRRLDERFRGLPNVGSVCLEFAEKRLLLVCVGWEDVFR